MLTVFKDQDTKWPSSRIEYYLVEQTSKVLWLCTDGDKAWAVNLGNLTIPKTSGESNFLDILIVTGVTQTTLEQVYKDLQYGVLVVFDKGVPGSQKNIFDITKTEEYD